MGTIDSLDYHSFSLNAGQNATVAVTSLTGGSLGVRLLTDVTGMPLAFGTARADER